MTVEPPKDAQASLLTFASDQNPAQQKRHFRATFFIQPSCGNCGVRLRNGELTQTCRHCGEINDVVKADGEVA
jgi:hypothetical protein